MGEFTYEHLFDVLRRERSREELQELEAGFYKAAEGYVEDQEAKLRSLDVLSEEGEQVRTQLQNAKKLLKELYDRREKKIMLLALNKARTGSSIIDTTALLPREKELFSTVVEVLTSFRGRVSAARKDAEQATASKETPKPPVAEPSEDEEEEPESEEEESSPNIRITASVPKFRGSNRAYGPFEEGEEISVPDRIAKILVRKGRAEEI